MDARSPAGEICLNARGSRQGAETPIAAGDHSGDQGTILVAGCGCRSWCNACAAVAGGDAGPWLFSANRGNGVLATPVQPQSSENPTKASGSGHWILCPALDHIAVQCSGVTVVPALRQPSWGKRRDGAADHPSSDDDRPLLRTLPREAACFTEASLYAPGVMARVSARGRYSLASTSRRRRPGVLERHRSREGRRPGHPVRRSGIAARQVHA